MFILYNILISITYCILKIFSLFNSKVKSFLEIRKIEKLKYENLIIQKKVYWLHAASVGELDQCKSLIYEIKSNQPNVYILQTYFSDSVQEKNFDTVYTDLTIHLPVDLYKNYDWIFKTFKPEKIVLMAWETWPNLIYSSKKFGSKIYLCSVNWDEKSKRNNFLISNFTKKLFSKLDGISPVNQSMENEFRSKFNPNQKIKSCGDSRFDSVIKKIESTESKYNLPFDFKKVENSKILILASTYFECEKIIFPILKNVLELDYKIWIFPHKINPDRISEIETELKRHNLDFSKFSNLQINNTISNIILFDVLGILASCYRYGKIAYIGGAAHNKIHNVLEPSYFGLPLISGNRIDNSFDALILDSLGCLKKIQTSEEFLFSFKDLTKAESLKRISNISTNYIKVGKGSSKKFYKEFIE